MKPPRFQGKPKSFDFAVGLGPVGTSAFWNDVQFGAGIAPGVGLVGRSVVGQHSLHDDTVAGEPGHGVDAGHRLRCLPFRRF